MKTLHTIYNNFAKRNLASLRLLLVMLLTLTASANAWGATYTLDQTSLTTSKSAYQTSDYTHTATDGSKWVLNGYGIITTSPKHIQLGKASKNYIKTPTCSGNITKVSITFAKACSYYVAIWDMDGNKASSTVANKPAANSTTTFTISGEHKQLQVIATRTTDGTSITASNAAAYISSITITYETAASYTVTYTANGGSGTMSNSTGSSIKIKECTFTAPECKQFTSWNTAANGSGTSYAPNATVETNLTLHAQWEDLPSYTVKLMDNNEVLTSSCNTPISLPSRDGCKGYTFVGWTKTWTKEQEEWTTTAPTIIPAGSYTPTANESLYPVYTKTETTQGTTTTKTDYVLTDLANIKSTDVVVITSKNSSDAYYAMSNNNGTGSAPTATSVTVSNNKLSSTPNDNLKWNISNNSGTLTIYKNGSTSSWLYCTSTNNGVRVGTNTNKTFTIDSSTGYLKHTGTSRYLGVYNNQDWRCYTNTTGNTANQTFHFFVETTTTTTTSTTTTSYISVPDCATPTIITLNQQGGAGGSESVTVTNGQPMQDITVPTRAGYNFQGYYTEEGGAGTQYYGADGKGVTNWDKEDATFTLYAQWTEKDLTNYRTFCEVVCDAYSFHTGTGDKGTWAKEAIKCFAQLGSTTEWQIKDYIIPADEKFFVGKYGYFYNDNLGTNNSRSSVKTWTQEMYIAPAMDMNDGDGSPKLGQAVGAKGTLRIFDNSGWNNLYVGFIPDGYKLMFGTTEHTFTLHNEGNHEWRSEEVVEYNSTTAAYNVSVGVVDAAGNYVATNHTQEMRHIFLDVASWGGDGNYGLYDITNETFTCLMHKTGYPNIYEGWVPASCQKVIFVRLRNSTPSWDNKWNQTGDLTLSNDKNLFTITQWDNQTTGWSVYERYGQFAMHDNSKSKNWYVHFVPHYVLTYDKNANDATGEMDVRTVAVDADDKKVIVANCGFTRPGYRFVKWQKDNTSTYYVPNGSTTINLTSDITLKAVWEKEYTVTYDANGGTTTCEDNNAYAKGETVTVCATPPTRAGHTFFAWSDDTNTYSAGATFTMPAKDVTLTAQWQINQYTVTLNPNYPTGKTGTFTDKEGNAISGNLVLTYNYNTASKTLTDLYKTLELDGYQFNGWFNATSGGSKWIETGKITKNITLYAQWTQRHTVTWMVNGEALDLDATYTSWLHDVKVNKLPPAPESRCGKVFVGWTTETIGLETNTPPAVLFKESDASPNVTADVTYHAVWADETLGGAGEQVTDVLNREWTGVSGTSYSTWSGKESTSGAVYMGNTAGGNSSIQMRAESSSGIVTTTSGGKAKKITVTWNSHTTAERTLDVYGKNTSYTQPTNLYDATLRGTKIGSIVCGTSTSLTIDGDYEFIGLRSKSGAMYLDEIIITWETEASTSYAAYTTAPVCAPVIEITEGKDIYVTGGNAGGTRDRVIAQQKVKFSAAYLKAGPTGQKPDVKVWAADITIGGVTTTKVEIDNNNITQNLTLQTDGTYAGTGEITITYKPTEFDVEEDVNVQLSADYNTGSDVLFDNFTVHARSLPQEFVIVAKQGDKWYALNGDMSGSKAQPANGQVVVDNINNPTKATFAPCNAVYTFDGMPNTGDRTYVRFQGTDGAWLWSSSGTNTGIQNNVLAQNPTGDNKAYNWKLTTTDNVTYQFGNANNNRNLRLNAEKFGMYTSGVQDIRILPVEAKCIYNYAPTNLKVSVLKSTSVTLTWDAVQGATKYQYSTDATNWTDAGTEPITTISGLTKGTDYTYYIRAYHEDEGVSQECIDYAEISFTTADCDDVPADITYSADLTSITVTWTAVSTNCTVRLYSDEACTSVVKFADGLNGSVTFSQLDRNTTYYVRVFAEGTCASPIVPVKTEDVEVDIVEWKPDGIVVDINTNEKVKVTLENEVSFGSGTGTVAEDLFFSKYFEANGNAKILAVYNGTNEKIDLSAIRIINKLGSGDLSLASFGHKETGYIYPGEEIILYNKGTAAVNACSEEQKTYSDWYNVEDNALMFGGRATLLLKRGNEIIDIIGAMDGSDVYNIPTTGYNNETEKPSWGDDPGWVCTNGDNIETTEVEDDYSLSTNRCLLVRKNTVVSGANAIEKNINKVFATLCEEWVGLQIPKNAPSVDKGETESCEGMAFVGDFDYSNYYTKYVSMNQDQVFEANVRNEDGTLTIPITDLNKQSCRNIKITIKDASDKDLKTQTYKVPIMITSDQTTAGQAFLNLQENLATVEIDGDGNPTGNKTNLTLDEVREICKTCDVVIRDNATLTKVATGTTNDHPQVNNVYIYEGASLNVPEDTEYSINTLSFRRKGDAVASADIQGDLNVTQEEIYLDLRVDAQNWHWFTLPYDCDIADVTWVDGTEPAYGVDWFLSTYDGKKRAETKDGWSEFHGTTIEAGVGYIVGILGDLNNSAYTYELRFPMAKEVLTRDKEDKQLPVRAWGIDADIRANHKGWNLVGNPYLNYYQTADSYTLKGLSLNWYTFNEITGLWYEEQRGYVPYLVIPQNGGWSSYEQVLASETDLLPFTSYFIQVGDPEEHDEKDELNAEFNREKCGRKPKSIARRSVATQEEPIIVGVSLINSLGESDKTSLVIDNRYTDEYEMNADFFKWFGDYYRYYTKPVVYTIGADKQQRAFNALNEEQAAQPISMGTYTAQNGTYSFLLDRRSDLSRVKEVWLHDATEGAYINLMQENYSFSAGRTDGSGRFTLSVTLHPKSPTDLTEGDTGAAYATTEHRTIYVNNLPEQAEVWVYDAVGRLLANERTSSYQRSYKVGQAGVYFVRVNSPAGVQTLQTIVEQ